MNHVEPLRSRQRIKVAVCVGLLVTSGVKTATAADSSIRVFAGDAESCIVGKREAITPLSLAMTIGSAIIRSSVSAIGRYLNNAAQSTSSPIMTAIGAADLFRIKRDESGGEVRFEPNLECLTIVTGVFGDLGPQGIPTDYAHIADPDGMFVKIDNGHVDASILQSLGLRDFPNSYVEFRLDRHENAEAFRLVPKIVYFRMTNAALHPRDAKNIEVTVTITKPSPTGALDVKKATEDNGLVAQLPIVVKQLLPGQVKRIFTAHYDNIWIAAPKKPPDDEVSSAKEKLGARKTMSFSPANLFITYREVDEPDLMLSILGSIVSDNAAQVDAGFEEALRSMLAKSSK